MNQIGLKGNPNDMEKNRGEGIASLQAEASYIWQSFDTSSTATG